MRTYDEMMKIIMDKAINDDRIRAVVMDGSRVNPQAVRDMYSDFDICYVVTDVREFTKDKEWIKYFGEILIVQYPEDWYSHPYDYTSRDNFAYLIQFEDGNRIDLRLIDMSNIKNELKNNEPRTVLLNKDQLQELIPVNGDEAFYIKRPSEMEYYNICNEFRWLSLYISKGLCRHEIYYAKYAYDCLTMPMFIKMINWQIGINHDFKVGTGAYSKYLKRYMTPEEMKRFQETFPNGTYEDIWNKLFLMYDYFAEVAEYVGSRLNYFFDQEETKKVRDFLCKRRQQISYKGDSDI